MAASAARAISLSSSNGNPISNNGQLIHIWPNPNSPCCHWPSSSSRRCVRLPIKAAKDDKRTKITADADADADADDSMMKKKQKQQQRGLDLEDVNPVGLGRRSRQLLDEVWRKFSGLGQISSTSRADERDALDALLVREGPLCEFAIPGAQYTTVLVVGPTSRIGRIVVRKLLLRGYTVKVKSDLLFLCASNSNFTINNR